LSIFSNVKTKWKIAKLKDRVKSDPSPAAVGELAQFYIQCGDNDSAYDLVALQMKEFPDSEVLKGIWNYLIKRKVGGKIRKTLKALEEMPTPENYISIIETYRQHNDKNSAMEYGRRFIKEFPEAVDAHRLMGEMRFERFSEDFAAKDGQAAETSMKQALELDPENIDAMLSLGRLYFCCGLTVRVRSLLDKVAEQDPEHREMQELRQALENLPEDDEEPYLRFSAIEERKGYFHDQSIEEGETGAVSVADDAETLTDCLEEALDIEGVTAASIVDTEGEELIAGDAGESSEPNSLRNFVSQVEKSARMSSLRMDIGSFQKGIIEGTDGGIVIRDLRGGTVTFRLEDGQHIKKTYPKLRNLVEKIAVVCGKSHERTSEGTE
jgi:predicted regulator of Ras-like GTPase activity (Roadblock/LC7/MglB family)